MDRSRDVNQSVESGMYIAKNGRQDRWSLVTPLALVFLLVP